LSVRVDRIISALGGSVPVLGGGLLYIGWRSPTLAFWDWARTLRLDGFLSGVRASLRGNFAAPPEWVRFTLPDALWVFALAWAMLVMTRGAARRERVAWLALPVALGPGAELLQLVGALPGTFDPLDLMACLIALSLAATAYVGTRRANTTHATPT